MPEQISGKKKRPWIVLSISFLTLIVGCVVLWTYNTFIDSEGRDPLLKETSTQEIEQIEESAIDWSKLQERNELYYIPNSSKPYTGFAKEYFRNTKQLKRLNQFQNGKKDGKSISWFKDGQKEAESNHKKGERHGAYATWHANGQQESVRFYPGGETEWYSNGQISMESKAKRYTSWHYNGMKWEEKIWKTESKNEIISIKVWDSKGDRCPLTNVLNGNGRYVLRDGLWRPGWEAIYKDSKLNGPSKWYSYGKLTEEGQYKNGKRDGVWTEYDTKYGYWTRRITYRDGKEIDERTNTLGETLSP